MPAALELCGLCLRPSPSCFFRLRNGKGASASQQLDLKNSRCLHLHRFSYTSAATESQSSPCTNVPVICPLCPASDSAIWKYNMKHHFASRHPSINFNDYAPRFLISDSEKEALRTRWSKHHQTQRSQKKKLVNPLLILEHHSSHRALRCVLLGLLRLNWPRLKLSFCKGYCGRAGHGAEHGAECGTSRGSKVD